MKSLLIILALALPYIQTETYVTKKNFIKENIDLVKQSLKDMLVDDEEIEHSDLLAKCAELFKKSEADFLTKYSRLCFTFDQFTLYESFHATALKDTSLKLTYERAVKKNEDGEDDPKGEKVYDLKISYGGDVDYVNYACDKAGEGEKDELVLNDIYKYFEIEVEDLENVKTKSGNFAEIPGFFKVLTEFAISGAENALKDGVESKLAEGVYYVKKGDNGKFGGDYLTTDQIVAHLKKFVTDQKMTQNCNKAYQDYFEHRGVFLGESVVHINMLADQKHFSITVYEVEDDGKTKLYTIEYDEENTGPEFSILKDMNDKKREIVGNVDEANSEDKFRIFDKGEFSLDLDIQDEEKLAPELEGDLKQVQYKSIFEGLKTNNAAMFCRMRGRNVFSLENLEKKLISFYSGSWNLVKKPDSLESNCPADIISEFNPTRLKLSQQEEKFADTKIETVYTEDKIYKPTDFGETEDKVIYFWDKIPSRGHVNPTKGDKERTKQLFGRTLIDFYLGEEFDPTKNTEEEAIDQKNLVENHSILLFSRFLLTEEGWVDDEFFDNISQAFMNLKTKNKVNFYAKGDISPGVEFDRVAPYLVANVLTCFGNRAAFDEADPTTNEEFLDNYLTKDRLLRI